MRRSKSSPDENVSANPNEGHRSRLLERFEKTGLEGLHDYEIIELFLSFVIPRKDLKPIAKTLIERFGNVTGVLNAPVTELVSVKGIKRRTACFLSFIREISAYCLKEKFDKHSLITSRKDIEQYLKFQFGGKREEYIAVMYLDTGNHCLATEIVAEGTVNQCAVYPRKIVERGLVHGAAAMILVHNHPGGALVPSKHDWNITKRLFDVGRQLEMNLLDHLIVSKDTTVSLVQLPEWPGK